MSSPASSTVTLRPPGRPAAGPRPGLVLLLSAGATFIAFLDTTVVNVAFPTWALWLPMGPVGGAAFDATPTALSTAAATSLPPQQFASGVGMTTTARQLGGALGVAATGVIIAAHELGGPQAFRDVYLACAARPPPLVGLAMFRILVKKESRHDS